MLHFLKLLILIQLYTPVNDVFLALVLINKLGPFDIHYQHNYLLLHLDYMLNLIY